MHIPNKLIPTDAQDRQYRRHTRLEALRLQAAEAERERVVREAAQVHSQLLLPLQKLQLQQEQQLSLIHI